MKLYTYKLMATSKMFLVIDNIDSFTYYCNYDDDLLYSDGFRYINPSVYYILPMYMLDISRVEMWK
jgi:hypothetical protein